MIIDFLSEVSVRHFDVCLRHIDFLSSRSVVGKEKDVRASVIASWGEKQHHNCAGEAKEETWHKTFSIGVQAGTPRM